MTFRVESRARRWAVALLAGVIAAACSEEQAPAPLLPGCAAATTTVTLAAGAYTSVDPASDSGCVAFPGNGTADTVSYLVIGQSAGGTPGDSTRFELSSATVSASAVPPAAAPAFLMPPLPPRARAFGPNARRFDRALRTLARTRAYVRPGPAAAPPRPPAAPASGPPSLGSLRTFQVCANYDCSTFDAVVARVQALGPDVAIYVDTTAPSGGFGTSGYDSLAQAFETHDFVVDTAAFGGVSDVDSNGVVLVLMTNVINSLVTTQQCQTGGFVAGFFFPGDLDPASRTAYNDGELFYTLVPDPTGKLSCPHTANDVQSLLPSTFAHELQHMISFNQHVLERSGPLEDLWLDESLSSLGEELSAQSYLPDTASFLNGVFGNLYDAYVYYLSPPSHFLLQTSDTLLPDFGAGWLYVRYLADQFGPGITRSLEQTNLTGTQNVAAQTGLPFETTAERWALANYVSDLPGYAPPAELQYTSWSFRGVFGSFYAQDPYDFPYAFPLRPAVSAPGSVSVSGELGAGSAAYAGVVQPPHSGGFTLTFRAGPTALISPDVVPRITILRLR